MVNKELEKVINKLKKEKEEKEEAEEEETEETEEKEVEEEDDTETPITDKQREMFEKWKKEGSQPKKKPEPQDTAEQQIVALREDGLYRTAKLYHLQEQNNLLKELIGIFKQE